MKRQVQCFFLEPSDTAIESFRRFCWSEKPRAKCPGPMSYHNVSVDIAVVPWEDKYDRGDIPSAALRADSRWPATCVCGYVFQLDDQWQHNFERQYIDRATGHKYSLRTAPPGAMWDAWWMPDYDRGKDGKALVVKLPDGCDWHVDGPSENGGPGWQRTGEPPLITATPSILTPNYHGFLTNGVLVDC